MMEKPPPSVAPERAVLTTRGRAFAFVLRTTAMSIGPLVARGPDAQAQ